MTQLPRRHGRLGPRGLDRLPAGRRRPAVTWAEAAAVVEELRAGADRSTGLVREFTGLHAADRHRAGRWSSTAPAGCRPTPTGSRPCSPRSSTSSPSDKEPVPARPRRRLAGHRRRGRRRCSASWPARCSASSTRSSRRPAGCCWSRPTSSTSSASSSVDPHDFRLWVCLHEETHRVQFTAMPWLARPPARRDARHRRQRRALRAARRRLGRVTEALKGGARGGNLLDAVEHARSRRRSSTGSPA